MKLYIVLALVACVSCSDLQSDSYELTGNRRSGPFETDVEKAAAGGTPWFCHDLECPRFKVGAKQPHVAMLCGVCGMQSSDQL